MRDKWLEYAVSVLKSINCGSRQSRLIAQEIGGPEAYIAKVVADLRRANIIDDNYDFVGPLQDLTVRKVLEASRPHNPQGQIAQKIHNLVLAALEVPISQIW